MIEGGKEGGGKRRMTFLGREREGREREGREREGREREGRERRRCRGGEKK